MTNQLFKKECGVAFNATSFYEYQNMPYCELHYHLKRGSLCNSCSQPINGRCITALNKKYHPEHFNCSFCLQTLNKGTFKTCPNEKPYCHQCFQKLFPIWAFFSYFFMLWIYFCCCKYVWRFFPSILLKFLSLLSGIQSQINANDHKNFKFSSI